MAARLFLHSFDFVSRNNDLIAPMHLFHTEENDTAAPWVNTFHCGKNVDLDPKDGLIKICRSKVKVAVTS